MKYKQSVFLLKRKVKEYLGARKVTFDLTRYQSGGGGAILSVVTWTDKDPTEGIRYTLETTLLPKWIKELEVDDLDILWQGLSIHVITRKYQEPLSEAPRWRFVNETET